MVLLGYFDLVLHYGEIIAKIVNVNPYRYSYSDLLDDVLNALVKIEANVGVSFEMEFKIWSDKSRRPITRKQDVLNMFNLNDITSVIDIHVNFNPTHPVNTQLVQISPSQVTQLPTSQVTELTVEQNLNKDVTIYYNYFTDYEMYFGDYEVDVVVEQERSDVIFSDFDGEWLVDGGETDKSSEDAIDLVSKEEDKNEGLSDFEEECEIMGKGKGSDSDREDIYIDRGI